MKCDTCHIVNHDPSKKIFVNCICKSQKNCCKCLETLTYNITYEKHERDTENIKNIGTGLVIESNCNVNTYFGTSYNFSKSIP